MTSFLAPILFIGVCLWVISFKYKEIVHDFVSYKNEVLGWPFSRKIFVASCFFLVLIILGIAFYASLFPPHLMQEFDALNYHLTLPRQHLILNSFEHISWSTADLYLMPLDFALAPYWLATQLPNKFPQFLFFMGLVMISVNLVRYFSKNNLTSILLMIFAVFGFHIIGIQAGTAMLDIVMAYLLLAALDSFIRGSWAMCAVEFAFYFWAKSFTPIQMTLILVGVTTAFFVLRWLGAKGVKWSLNCDIDQRLLKEKGSLFKKVTILFLILSIVIGGPFIAKTIAYVGTPLFPFGVGMMNDNTKIDRNSQAWESLVAKSQLCLATRNQYGSGRSIKEFIRHLWLIAVPEKGVNNRYDYPVGLMYLLFSGPFFVITIQALWKRQFPLLSVFVIVFWLVWWTGTHQTRFLFVPLLLMLIVGVIETKIHTRMLMVAMFIALALVSLSVFRAHKNDFGKSRYEVLRQKDKELLELSRSIRPKEKAQINFYDAAFAQFPINVIHNSSVFVLEYE